MNQFINQSKYYSKYVRRNKIEFWIKIDSLAVHNRLESLQAYCPAIGIQSTIVQGFESTLSHLQDHHEDHP